MKVCVVAAVSVFGFMGGAHAQAVTSFADVAGSWRGYGLKSGIDTMIIISPTGQWTTTSKIGTESGQGTIKDGAFHLEWKGGYGNMDIVRTAAGITAKSKWYNGSSWIIGQVDATRCQQPKCEERGPFVK